MKKTILEDLNSKKFEIVYKKGMTFSGFNQTSSFFKSVLSEKLSQNKQLSYISHLLVKH